MPRRVKLSNLPKTCTSNDISRIVWGGSIHSIQFTKGDSFATVKFTTSSGCMKYLGDTANDILWPGSNNVYVVVSPVDTVDPLNADEKEWIEKDVTRCVKILSMPRILYDKKHVLLQWALEGGRQVTYLEVKPNKNGVSAKVRVELSRGLTDSIGTLSRSALWQHRRRNSLPACSQGRRGFRGPAVPVHSRPVRSGYRAA